MTYEGKHPLEEWGEKQSLSSSPSPAMAVGASPPGQHRGAAEAQPLLLVSYPVVFALHGAGLSLLFAGF
jgi:hypothetical protein